MASIRDDYCGIGWAEGLAMLDTPMREIGLDADADVIATRHAAGHLGKQVDLAGPDPYPGRSWDGYIASPPCQTFSVAGSGKGREATETIMDRIGRGDWSTEGLDDKTAHVLRVAQMCAELDTDWICLEQVPPVLVVWRQIGALLVGRGYSVWVGVLNSADYGVPQTRRRAVLIASRVKEVGKPPATHEDRWIGWGEVLSSVDMDWTLWTRARQRNSTVSAMMPAPTVDAGAPSRRPWVVGEETAVKQWRIDGSKMTDVDEHPLMRRVTIEEIARIQSFRSFPPSDWVLDRRQGSNEKTGRRHSPTIPATEPAPTFGTKSGGQWIFYHRDDEGKTTGRGGDGDLEYLNITVQGAERVQSFRGLPWVGNKRSVCSQIGNAVPPLLAAHVIAEAAGLDPPDGDIKQ